MNKKPTLSPYHDNSFSSPKMTLVEEINEQILVHTKIANETNDDAKLETKEGIMILVGEEEKLRASGIVEALEWVLKIISVNE